MQAYYYGSRAAHSLYYLLIITTLKCSTEIIIYYLLFIIYLLLFLLLLLVLLLCATVHDECPSVSCISYSDDGHNDIIYNVWNKVAAVSAASDEGCDRNATLTKIPSTLHDALAQTTDQTEHAPCIQSPQCEIGNYSSDQHSRFKWGISLNVSFVYFRIIASGRAN